MSYSDHLNGLTVWATSDLFARVSHHMAAVAAPKLAAQQHTPLQERKGEREKREGTEGRKKRRGGRRGKRVG